MFQVQDLLGDGEKALHKSGECWYSEVVHSSDQWQFDKLLFTVCPMVGNSPQFRTDSQEKQPWQRDWVIVLDQCDFSAGIGKQADQAVYACDGRGAH